MGDDDRVPRAPSPAGVPRDRLPGTIHIRFHRRHGWEVRRIGTKTAISVHRSLLHAERSGRAIAESEHRWLFIHDVDGSVVRADTLTRRPIS